MWIPDAQTWMLALTIVLLAISAVGIAYLIIEARKDNDQ